MAARDQKAQDDAELLAYLSAEGYSEFRWLGDKGWCGLHDYLFTCGIVIGMGPTSYGGRYCYPSREEAARELLAWDGSGDPGGDWIKFKSACDERLGPGASM